MKQDTPLNFYAVSQHACYLGITKAMADPSTELSKHADAGLFADHENAEGRSAAYQAISES